MTLPESSLVGVVPPGRPGIAIVLVDRDLCIQDVAGAEYSMPGVFGADAAGRSLRATLPELARIVEPRLREVFATGQAPGSGDLVEIPVRGVARRWRVNCVPVRSLGGSTLGVDLVFHDSDNPAIDADGPPVEPIQTSGTPNSHSIGQVSDTSEQGYRVLLDQVPVGIAHVGLDGSWLLVNDRFCQITGYRQEELFGLDLSIISHRDDLTSDQVHLDRLLAGENSSYTAERRYIRKDGTIVRATVTIALVRDDLNRPLHFILIVEDVSHSRRIEAELRLSEQQFRFTFDQAPVGIGLVRLDGTWLTANDRLCQITGYSRDELVNRTFQSITYPDDIESDVSKHAQLVSGEVKSYTIEKRYIRKDNTPVWVSLTVSLMRDASHNPVRFISIVEDISERMRVEQELRLNEQRFQIALRGSPIVVFNQDRDLRYTWIRNPGNGMSEEQVIGKRDIEIAERESDGRELERVKRSAMESRGTVTEEVAVWTNGIQRFYSLTAEPMVDSWGLVTGVACSSIDITDRKHREVELRQANDRFERALVSMEGFVYEYDLSTGYVNRSAGLAKVIGYEPDEVPPHWWWWIDRVAASDRDRVRQAMEAPTTGDSLQIEYRVRHKGGHFVDVRDAAMIIRGYGGQPRRLIGSTVNITSRKRMEVRQSLLAGVGNLVSSEFDFEDVVHRLPELVVPALAEVCMIYTIDEYFGLWQVSENHVDPVKAELLRALRAQPIDLAGPHPAAIAIRTGQDVVNPRIDPEIIRTAAEIVGSEERVLTLIPRSQIIVPLIARNEVIGALSLGLDSPDRAWDVEDISTAQELGRRAALMIDNIRLYRDEQEAVKVRDTFLSIASHELKTPLTALIGHAQQMQRRLRQVDNVTDRDRRALRVIVEQGQRLDRLISSLLDVSRLQQGQLQISREFVDIGVLVRGVLRDIEPGLDIHKVSADIPSDPLPVLGDRTRLEQVFENLLQNAVKYSPNGGDISVVITRRDSKVVVTVTDRGMGIPEGALPKLFQRFYRAENVTSQNIAGMGVGLYVVREIIDLHHGEISVTSIEGAGSTFTVVLPLANRENNEHTG